MQLLKGFAAFLGIFLVSHAQAQVDIAISSTEMNIPERERPHDRVEADRLAKEAFFNLHFFSEGRGMHLVPGLIEIYNYSSKVPGLNKLVTNRLKGRWGLNVVDNKYVGLYSVDYKKMSIGVLGCVVCHSGKAAGRFVVGLGNKNIDVLKLAEDAWWIQNTYKTINGPLPHSKDFKEVEKSALEFAKALANPKLANLTQGLVTVSFIRTWFYKQAGIPIPDTLTRGAVKIPSLWGYGEKRPVGQFSDGFGNGVLPGWAIAVELTGGQTPETVMKYLPKVEAAEELFSDFLPPRYPFKVDQPRAAQGQAVYQKNCMGCHGQYAFDQKNLPLYEAPKWIPLEVVQTDADRLESNTEEFHQLVENNPLNNIIKANRFGRGYFAPRLVGIWSRFPYLHNASVPSISALLEAPEARPKIFSLKDSGERYRFDEKTLGLTLPQAGSRAERTLQRQARAGARNVYWTERIGQSNQGHRYGVNLNAEEKANLVEYLKTL